MRLTADHRPQRLSRTLQHPGAARAVLGHSARRLVWINRRVNMLPIYGLCLAVLCLQWLGGARAK